MQFSQSTALVACTLVSIFSCEPTARKFGEPDAGQHLPPSPTATSSVVGSGSVADAGRPSTAPHAHDGGDDESEGGTSSLGSGGGTGTSSVAGNGGSHANDGGASGGERNGGTGASGAGGSPVLDGGGHGGAGGADSSGGVGGGQAGGSGGAGEVEMPNGGAAGGGAAGSGGASACDAAQKLCGDVCVSVTECCGECSGNTPVCSEEGSCVQLEQGSDCSADAECATGFCSDGYCCDSACAGQCESCQAPGNVGTCVPVTTPRTPCGGSGPCQGVCDGTAQHRSSCVYPGSSTACGAPASCTNSSFTSASTCNGSGACNAGTMMSCMYECRTDGIAGCATSCPPGEDLCGGSCVSTQSNPSACGSTCQVCGGSTPRCVSGTCVECTVVADCGDGMTCTAQNTCGCANGYHNCGADLSECFSDTDVEHCGNACTDCTQPNANAACGAGDQCANACKNSLHTLSCPAVGGKPNCAHWDFESGTAESWTYASASDADVGALSTSTAHATAGSRSLAIRYDNDEDPNRYIEIRVQLCAGGNVLNLSGKRIRWNFRMTMSQEGGYNYLIVYDSPGFGFAGGLFDFNTDADGEWDTFDYELPAGTFDTVFGIGFHLQTTDAYDGTMYLDDIQIY